MLQMSQVSRERAIGMLTAGMSTKALARECHVNCSTINHLQRHFREYGHTPYRPHTLPHQPRTSTPEFLSYGIVWKQPPRQLMKLRSLSVCNKALLWGKTQSDWLGLGPQWVCPPRSTHGCAPAQLCEIHRLGPNEYISIDWFHYMNCKIVEIIACLVYIFVQYRRCRDAGWSHEDIGTL
jgi:hypothetical protein